MRVLIISIHHGSPERLIETAKSVICHLDKKIFAGYLIYESGGKSIGNDVLTMHPNLIYKHNMPTLGISIGLNESVRLGQILFPSATHHCFIHSGDRLDPDQACSKVLETKIHQNDVNLIFWNHAFSTTREIDISKPQFASIRSAMTVAHIGTFIANRLHNEIGGYKECYKYAMDYEFMLKASLAANCTYLELDCVMVKMDGHGTSAQHPFKSIAEVWLIKNRILAKTRKDKLVFFLGYIKAVLRRFAYESLRYTPFLRRKLRMLFNPRLKRSLISCQVDLDKR